MKLIMLGAPGAGKGTQAAILAKKCNIPHISTGDALRMHIKNQTELGKEAEKFMNQGLLVPDNLVMDLVKDRIRLPDCKNGFILDGFPRTMHQAKAFDEALEDMGTKLDYAVNVDVPDENIIRRMDGRRVCPKCGATYHNQYRQPFEEGICDKCNVKLIQREDDQEKTVKRRLQIYHDQTKSLIEYYEEKALLLIVDGTKDVEEVTKNIMQALGESA